MLYQLSKSPIKSPSKSPVKKIDNKTNKKVVIIGDSILNGIQENGISNNTTNVKIRNHPGATSEDMCDFIKPESRKNPNVIIVHVGTNELKDNKKTLENFKKMNDTVKAKTPMCKFVISDVVIRKDKPEMEKKVKEFNEIKLHKFGKKNNIDIINNSNLDGTCLSYKKLHLNQKGNSYLANNFIDYLDNL